MTSKPILTAAAIFLFALGLALSFLPQETAAALGIAPTPAATLLVQIVSAGLLAMGYLNWLSKHSRMGGIYSRPLGLANMLQFAVAAIALDRAAFRIPLPPVFIGVAILYTLFALAFIWLLFFADPFANTASKDPLKNSS